MASIYFNGTEIDEINDDVYVNGTPLAIGKSVYLNGSIVWTKQLGCYAATSGTSVSQFTFTNEFINQNAWKTYRTKTVDSGVCSSSACSARVGTLGGSAGGGYIVTTSGRIQKNGTTQVTVSHSQNYYIYSSTVVISVNPSDVITFDGSQSEPATSFIGGDVWTGNAGTLF